MSQDKETIKQLHNNTQSFCLNLFNIHWRSKSSLLLWWQGRETSCCSGPFPQGFFSSPGKSLWTSPLSKQICDRGKSPVLLSAYTQKIHEQFYSHPTLLYLWKREPLVYPLPFPEGRERNRYWRLWTVYSIKVICLSSKYYFFVSQS